MATFVTPGDRLVTASGRASWLKRPSVPFSAYYGGGTALVGNATVSYTQLYRTQPWAAIAINKLSRQIARLPLKVYRLDSQGNRERVREGALVDLLTRPWERGSDSSLKQSLAMPMLLHGNSLLGKRRPSRNAAPSSFEILDWRYLTPQTEYDWGGRILFWEDQSAEKRFIDPAEVIHTAWMAPEGEVGVSPLQQLGVTIRMEDAAQRYSTSSFDNAVRSSGAFVLPPDVKLKPEEREELRQEIQDTHGGVENAFKIMLLAGGADWKPFSQTAKEAELIEARKINREEIAAVYDIPPPMIGILDQATYSNIGEQHKMLFTDVLAPHLDLIEKTLQAQLIAPEPAFEGLFVEFDLNDVLKGDPEKRIPALRDGIGTGLYTINEARKIENLPRIDDPVADAPLIPVNNLKPLGQPAPEAPPPMLASHIARARDRVLSKAGAGETELLDVGRFERELASDSGDASLARIWAQTLDEGIKAAGPDPDRLKQFFSALSA